MDIFTLTKHNSVVFDVIQGGKQKNLEKRSQRGVFNFFLKKENFAFFSDKLLLPCMRKFKKTTFLALFWSVLGWLGILLDLKIMVAKKTHYLQT